MRTFNWKKRRLEKSSDGARVTFSVGRRVGLFFSRPSPERLSAEARSEGGGEGERREEAAGAIVERSRRESRGHGRGRESEIRE